MAGNDFDTQDTPNQSNTAAFLGLANMLAGLQTFLDRTRGQSPVMRGTAAAFGFVYVHPLAAGNARVHRFLVDDVLRRDGVVQDPMILPVSSLITSDAAERRAYDRILDARRATLDAHACRDHPLRQGPDRLSRRHRPEPSSSKAWSPRAMPGVTWTWACMSATWLMFFSAPSARTGCRSRAVCAATARAVRSSRRSWRGRTRRSDRVIRSIQNNKGELSGALRKELPILVEPGLWEAIVQAVHRAFEVGPRSDAADKYDGARKYVR